MKACRLVVVLAAVAVLCQMPFAHAQTGDERALLESYFAHLQNGDTEQILSLLAEPMLAEKQNLLHNSSYSEFLRKAYASSSYQINRIMAVKEDERSIAVVDVYMSPGDLPLATRFVLVKENGAWKIAGEELEL